MAQINAYIFFNGDCEHAFNFYKSVFGGDFTFTGRYSDMPGGEGKVADADKNKIMHMSLPIGANSVIMGCDALEGPQANASNINLSINAESEEEAKRLFEGLSVGGKVTMPLEKTFWNAFFGMFTDKFGINWMVNYEYGEKK